MKKIPEFVMRCSNIKERNKAINVLTKYGVIQSVQSHKEQLTIYVYANNDIMRFMCYREIGQGHNPYEGIELTYSQFMEQYGNPVKTSDLIKLKKWIIKNYCIPWEEKPLHSSDVLKKIDEMIDAKI